MSCPGVWDRGGKFVGDRVICVDASQYGRKGTVIGDPAGFGATVVVLWDGDDTARLVPSSSVRIDTSEED